MFNSQKYNKIPDKVFDREEFKDLSIITFKHMIGNKNFGTIGIIGPKRMDYSKVISVMKYINKKLNEELNDNDTENW